ncbi:NUDIX hydrolase [Pseudonocardia endophytica]|uniref:NUDIX domain-containing protein n=1 Tax=Pseudonocardia endophytica TaxID=401976 RepID=A0A4R1HNH5_PSEEN|nr:NUDIX domain-containing protein [Pseudonocardia endophytica]TCK22155.1 NUDIX domain-containing protein [Pseudonocardia endophytica]
MRPTVAVVHELVRSIDPADELEAEHRRDTLRWLEGTEDVFRRVKPATPSRHLVSYIAVVDHADHSSLLVDHVKSGLWLPPGGHVEPDEHPAATADREAREELGIDAGFVHDPPRPSFLTVTRTVGTGDRHTDVSLWFVTAGTRGMPVTIDRTEFTEARWWAHRDALECGPGRLDPHYQRFVTKIAA